MQLADDHHVAEIEKLHVRIVRRLPGEQPNVYVYVGDDPINRRDPTGLKFIFNDPSAIAPLANLASNPAIGQLIDQLEASTNPIYLDSSELFDALTNHGGSFTYAQDGKVMVLWNLDYALSQPSSCGRPAFDDLDEILAHELGHVYSVVFPPDDAAVPDFEGYSNNLSIIFENAARPGPPYRSIH